ncbi:MAG: hypothetical protein Fur0025_26880 [Oscillatoriaceae cyanobacterium]
MKNIPNFMIIGAQKCGTTSLYNYLTAHPQVIPAKQKEIHFFDNYFEKGVDWYLKQFPSIDYDKNLITGEASPYYIFHPHVPQRLYRLFPATKLIVLLRNPVERAISHYYMELSRGDEYLSLAEAIAKESDRVDLELAKLESDPSYYSIAHRRYSYLSRGLYREQLQRWFDWFPQEQFLILKSEDLFAHPAAIVRQVFKFLELPEYELPEYRRYMAGNYGQIDRGIKAALSEYFRPHNRQLEQYLGREFNWDTDNWDSGSESVNNPDPIQAKQELCQKLAALSQVSPEQIRTEIAPWQRLEIPNSPEPKRKKPNILLLMSDQHREDAMGCSGGWVRTPNLDRLAAEGIRFSNCITTSPVCIPTRLSLVTGWYPHNTGIWDNCNYTLSPDSRTWMQVIRAQGYRTALFGKTHWHSQKSDLRDGLPLLDAYGFDEAIEVSGPRANTSIRSQMTDEWEAAGLWQPYKDDFAERFRFCPQIVRPSPLGLYYYYDVWVARQACHYLESYSGEEPWFCWVSFPGPHEPWDAPEPYATLYDPANMPVPAPIPTMEPNRPTGWFDEQIANPRVVLDESDPPQMRGNYAGNVTLIDDQIGEILGVIQRRGELENTIIVYISDHGEMNGDCGLTYKSNFMKGSVQVPLLIRTPETLGSVAGSVYPYPVELLDVGPTLVALAGGTLDYPQFGKSLVPVLRDPNQLHREDALSEIRQEVMLLQSRWKIALNQQGQVYLLFDIENDPQETTNLAGRPDMMKISAELRYRILERIKQSQVQSEI